MAQLLLSTASWFVLLNPLSGCEKKFGREYGGFKELPPRLDFFLNAVRRELNSISLG